MRITASFICVAFLFFPCLQAAAQKTPPKAVAGAQKYKPPRLYTYLGDYKDSASVTVTIAEAIIGARLKVVDDAKNEYSISSYQLLYKKRTVTEDEKTGKPLPASSIVSNLFKKSPLPALWIEKIREEIIPGEELFFFDVIVKDSKGRVMYAPNLKILTTK